MKRILQCPTCLAKFNVDISVAGKTVACSKCNAKFTADMFPYANEEMLPNPQSDPDEPRVSVPPPVPPAFSPPSPEKKPRSLWKKVKIAYVLCMFPFALLFTAGPILLRNNQDKADEQLVKYLNQSADERINEFVALVNFILPPKTTKRAAAQSPKVSYALQAAIHRDKVKRADDLRNQGKPLLDAWTESGLIVQSNLLSGDVLIDPAAWQTRSDTDTQIEMVKSIGAQIQSKANMKMTVTLYCSETGRRLGTYHAGGQISVYH